MYKVTVTLYGPLAVYAGGKYIAQHTVELAEESTIKDLLDRFEIPYEEKSYLFINNILSDMPGLQASLGEKLKEGDRVGVFSRQHMWPYQYRDGIRMSETLTNILAERDAGAMHNIYE